MSKLFPRRVSTVHSEGKGLWQFEESLEANIFEQNYVVLNWNISRGKGSSNQEIFPRGVGNFF